MNKKEQTQWQIIMICANMVAILSVVILIVDFINFQLFQSVSFSEFIHGAAGTIGTAGVGCIVGQFLRNLLKSQSPFTKKSVSYLTVLGVWVMVYTVLLPMVADIIVSMIEGVEYSIRSSMDGGSAGIFIGIAIVIMAEIFQYGIRLQEDIDSIA